MSDNALRDPTRESILAAIERLEYRLRETLAEAGACRTALEVLRLQRGPVQP
jgi:hypothetical protein